jgi:TatA/E family protein of Tat protein translocase
VFGISGFKLLIIIVGALVLLGPDKVPEIGRTLGKALQMFNAAKDDMERLVKADMFTLDESARSAAEADKPVSVASTLYVSDGDEEEEEEE